MVNISLKSLILFICTFLNFIYQVQSICEKNCSDCTILTKDNTLTNFPANLNKNTIVVIELQGNPTTGYGWYLSQNTFSTDNVLQPLNLNQNNSTDEFYTDVNNSGSSMTGIGGTYCFKFSLKNINKTSLLFDYYRPWEKTNSIISSLNFTFTSNTQTNISIQSSNIVNLTLSVGNYTPNFSGSLWHFVKLNHLINVLCLFCLLSNY